MNKIENDFTKAFEKFFSATPVNYEDAVKNVAEYNAKFSKIALEAAKKNAQASNESLLDEIAGQLDGDE